MCGRIRSRGDYDSPTYTITSHSFAPDETLLMCEEALELRARQRERIDFTSKKGATLVAGPEGLDHELSVLGPGASHERAQPGLTAGS